ncbi:MAG: heme-binding domain-containing protein [Chitinophagaceae bacterium]|nr:heme-binding domain-containing protein [Chitinophagaceae bacterium]
MKNFFKTVLIILLVIFIVIQFFRPAKNLASGMSVNDITTKYEIPDTVKKILRSSCYDCHSNNTVYPWYAQVQPVAWWLNGHINDGKRGLNFSEFAAYPIRKQFRRLSDINELVKKNEMPLTSYLIIHKYAKLSDGQKLLINNWTSAASDTIRAHYPPDSLLKK